MTTGIAYTVVRLLATGLGICLLALPCGAQPGSGGISLRSNLAVANCSQARDPARCLAMQEARAACQRQRGAAKRQCLRGKLPAPDCHQAPDPQRCQARLQAQAACRAKTGKLLRQCLREHSASGTAGDVSVGASMLAPT